MACAFCNTFLKKLILRGAVHFVSPQSKVLSAAGYYIAYAWQMEIDLWEQFDDLLSQPKAVRNTSQIPVRLLIYGQFYRNCHN